MRTLGNILWLVFAGIWMAISYAIAGVIMCIRSITIPFGIASFRMARYVLWPFGSIVVKKPNAGAGSAVMNAIWFVIAGWWLALVHIATALAQSLTIIGLANAWVSIKMIPVTCFPFGKDIVDSRTMPAGTRPLHSL
mgnify:CR=1 FL=1